MKKLILLTLIAMGLLTVSPVSAAQNIEIVDTEQALDDITISVRGNVLHITGANGQTLYVYNIAGVCIHQIKVEGADKHYDLGLTKGCYIIKVGNVVRKISVK